MKKMGLVFLLFFALDARSQIVAADSLSPTVYYSNITDIPITFNADSIDFDLDGMKDIYFDFSASGNTYHTEKKFIHILQNNVELAMAQPTGTWLDTVACGTLIDNTKNWKGGTAPFYLNEYVIIFMPPNNYTYNYYGLYWGSANQYMGFRMIYPNDTLYGWLEIGPGASKAKAFAMQRPSVGINSFKQPAGALSVFPNPGNAALNVLCEDNSSGEVYILDQSGLLVKEMPILPGKVRACIDISDFPEGIYFVQVKTSVGILTKKIIVQR